MTGRDEARLNAVREVVAQKPEEDLNVPDHKRHFGYAASSERRPLFWCGRSGDCITNRRSD